MMEAIAAQVLVQAQNLRALCAEFAHGARRDAFLALVDADIEALFAKQLRLTIIALDSTSQALQAEFAGNGAQAQVPGLTSVKLVQAADAVWTSPVLMGQLLKATDLVLVCGDVPADQGPLVEGLAQLATVCEYGLQWSAASTAKGLPFRHSQALAPMPDDSGLRSALVGHLTPALRLQMLVAATWARLAQTADLLQKAITAEVAALKFRATDMARIRLAEDAATADIKEQTDPLRAALEQWTQARKDEIARSNEDGVLPFDPRLLASRLTIDNLLLRLEHSAAETKYPILKAKMFQSLVSHHYSVVPDPAAIDGIRSQLLNALDLQVRKDVELFNQQSGELVDQLRRGSEVYPAFAHAIKTMRLPILQRASFDRLFNAISLDAAIEDSHTRLGLFKRLAEGRMFASMAFSFVTMSAGVFVLFGEPSIKRGLMKFSGVIVIVMVLYFVFSMLVKSEEEKKTLEEKLEKMREQVNQSVMRPLAKAEQGIVKTYQAFVEEVKATVAMAMDGVLKQKALAKAQLTDARKLEDELVKGFLARRQQAGAALSQKLPAFIMGLDKARQASERSQSGPESSGVLPMRTPLVARPTVQPPATPPSAAPASAQEPPRPRVPVPAPAAASPPPPRSAAMERVAAMAKARLRPDSSEGTA